LLFDFFFPVEISDSYLISQVVEVIISANIVVQSQREAIALSLLDF